MGSRQSVACEEYLAWALPEVRRLGHFQTKIASGRLEESDGNALVDAYVAAHGAIVSPILTVGAECRLFEADKLNAPPSYCTPPTTEGPRWRSEFLSQERGAHRIAVNSETRDHARFWWWLICSNARPLVLLPSTAAEVLSGVFAQAFDPVIVGNVGASVSRRALSFAQRRTEGDDAIAILITRTVHSVDLMVFASEERIAKLFETALHRARRTEGFVALHCTDWVRPMEIGSPALWTKLNSSRDDLSILIDVLRRARDTPEYDERITLNGLVAAELVATIFGRPPKVFYGKDPKIDEAIQRWARDAGERSRLAPEAVDLAREVLNRTATQSPLPNRLWRSERRCAAWRDVVTDLEHRLAQALNERK